MESPDIEALAQIARRRALLIVIRAHPEWTLEQLLEGLDAHAVDVSQLTIRELCSRRAPALATPVGANERATRYERAFFLHGPEFVELVYEVMLEAGSPVQTRYLRARLGGPRWKVKGALERLCAAGRVLRFGVTSDTFYELAPGCSETGDHADR